MGDTCVWCCGGYGGHVCGGGGYGGHVCGGGGYGGRMCVYTTQFLVCQDMTTARLPQTVVFVSLPPPLTLRAPLGPSQGSQKRELATLHQPTVPREMLAYLQSVWLCLKFLLLD